MVAATLKPVAEDQMPPPVLFTCDDLLRMEELGVVPSRRLHLVEGVVIDAATGDPHQWTFEQYITLDEDGMFGGDHETELIFGRIYHRVPHANPHLIGTYKTQMALSRVFPPPAAAIAQSTHRLERHSPEPDVCVIPHLPEPHGYDQPHPLLVVEVSESTLRMDQHYKAALYAEQGIEDYWLLNLVTDRVEVRRDPVEDPRGELGWRYITLRTFARGESVAPLARPGAEVMVDDLLP